MNLKLKRTPGIFLVGFMGSGKTTIGRELAYELGWSFVDTDEDIETAEGMGIFEIFDKRGEPEFRRLEHAAIQKRVRVIQTGRPMVVALGGGAYAHQDNFELIENNGLSVWLDCPLAAARSRVEAFAQRPLARDPEKFAHLYFARRASYQRADFRVENAGNDIKSAVSAILALPIF